jgi:hypothetical protein
MALLTATFENSPPEIWQKLTDDKFQHELRGRLDGSLKRSGLGYWSGIRIKGRTVTFIFQVENVDSATDFIRKHFQELAWRGGEYRSSEILIEHTLSACIDCSGYKFSGSREHLKREAPG